MKNKWSFLKMFNFKEQERLFFHHYYKLGAPMDKVCWRLSIKKTRFYEIKKAVYDKIVLERRRAKIKNPSIANPFEEETPAQIYINKFGQDKYDSLAARRKNDEQWLLKKAGHSAV